jgi:nicotinate dehydrogenase subunit B
MLQIAAEELDVGTARITLQSGDTEFAPNEGCTSGSQSIQVGGVALRLACAEVRLLFLERAAQKLDVAVTDVSVADGTIICRGGMTAEDYWTLAESVDLTGRATGRAPTKASHDYNVVGTSTPRVDLTAELFGKPVFIHDLVLDGMQHARVIRQPGRHATIASIDEAAIHRLAQAPIQLVRHGNFLAVVAQEETVAEAVAAAAASHVAWDGSEPVNPFQEEVRWLLQQPSIDRLIGPEAHPPAAGVKIHEATYSRAYFAHASIGPSCGVALFSGGRLQVWTHSQGVYPLKAALARMLELEHAAISVRHVQGPGCYGHNGADDAQPTQQSLPLGCRACPSVFAGDARRSLHSSP